MSRFWFPGIPVQAVNRNVERESTWSLIPVRLYPFPNTMFRAKQGGQANIRQRGKHLDDMLSPGIVRGMIGHDTDPFTLKNFPIFIYPVQPRSHPECRLCMPGAE